MRVAFIQMQPEFGNINANVDKAISLMNSRLADLFVLPELFNTGYLFVSSREVVDLAEPARDGWSGRSLADYARAKDCGIVYGFAEQASGTYYNSAAFVGPDGAFVLYRKLHLFSTEKEYFSPGDIRPEVFNFRTARIGMMICFDWIFPEMTRTLALKGADIICQPANLVLPYCQDAMRIRSIENRVFTITANRIGAENRGGHGLDFTGRSQITDCSGHVLIQASQDKEEAGCADINSEDARNKNINASNNLWRDRRQGFYELRGENG